MPRPPRQSPHEYRPRSLLWDGRIALVWGAGLVAWLGNHALFVVLPFVVFDSTGSPAATALTVLSAALPPVLLGQVAGVVSDRWDRRRILLGANLALMILTLGYLAVEAWPWIAALSFVRNCFGQLVGPSEHALLPELAPTDRLGEIASLNTLNNSLARLVGPAVGGTMLAMAGFPAAIWTVAVCHGLSALLVAAVDHRRPSTESCAARPGMIAQWRDGAALVSRHPALRALVPVVALMALGEGFVSALLAPFARELLNAGPDALGWILSAQAVGGVLGSLWATWVADRRDAFPLLVSAAFTAGVLLLAVFTYPHVHPVLWPAVVLTALAGAPFAVVAAMQGTLLQTQSPSVLRGRVFSVFWGIASVVQIAAIGLAGVLAERVGSGVIVADAIAYLAAGVVGIMAVRRLRDDPRRRDLNDMS
ncbi:MFS transporter [Brachybacterium sacelli]|uniref:MFS family arabinose efflux permease n=1 Tax=Brachybacterium sacelli TaxID=173364 RepID=A0ABS4WX27_9MICO|nr:MFS transporter [Brachybacterium sacelli]MBP2380718.1 putative MFS family arabinose efflux permease [Brachybacterium sacelli]